MPIILKSKVDCIVTGMTKNRDNRTLSKLSATFQETKTADPNPFIDNSLIKPLEDSGLIKGLYQQHTSELLDPSCR